ncbi:helix-turn-helix transcriptional regulator [Chromobacterium phragmitis]|uniref:helix-turn-helix domain-containing protein n=1 Tax=Chromobacterium amazonense TaxID=1382803 RepID=UPI0021B76B72|nr:helix-turn-helix transcriptional regulator [Chromobacterium amazonense]MBM2884882.1 helix-turn-helix transcriptional regulator [Chromobacterium amazonense]MDE1714772.1 helix-turn-helix transcriptional regulator [Chromobacterium amazonense]
MNTVGERLRFIRKQRKLSQAQLAQRAGVGTSTIGSLECGKSRSSTLLPQIAVAVRANPIWLASGKGQMEPVANSNQGAYAHADSREELALQIAEKGLPEALKLVRRILNLLDETNSDD